MVRLTYAALLEAEDKFSIDTNVKFASDQLSEDLKVWLKELLVDDAKLLKKTYHWDDVHIQLTRRVVPYIDVKRLYHIAKTVRETLRGLIALGLLSCNSDILAKLEGRSFLDISCDGPFEDILQMLFFTELAAFKIQHAWRHVISDPQYRICRRRLQREWSGLIFCGLCL